MQTYTIAINNPAFGMFYLLREAESDRAAKIIATRARASAGAQWVATLYRVTSDGERVHVATRDARGWVR